MRLGWPCQNSIIDGRTRNPPQCGGQGTVSPSKRRSTRAYASVSSSTPATSLDCGEAHAPSWEPRGRVAK